jgi:hypothetical protein
MTHQEDAFTEPKWKPLYRAGAAAPLIALIFYLIEFSILLVGKDPYPASIEDWYAIFQRSKILGLWYLNALDIVSFMLLGVMFLALYMAFKPVHPSRMLIALYFALLGVVVFIVPRMLHLALLPLSDLYGAATTEAESIRYLTAGEALSQVSSATPQTLGFLLTTFAGLIISLTIVSSDIPRSEHFGKAAGYVGIAGFAAALANYVARTLAPSAAGVLMPFSGLLGFAWWLLISRGLFRLARRSAADET